MPSRLLTFALRRAAAAIVLILLVASAALLLARLAPGDHLSPFDLDPVAAAAERRRLGLDAPLLSQYLGWVGRLTQLDLGDSTRYPGRSVASLLFERAGTSLLLGCAALVLATMVGVPLGVVSGSRPPGVAMSGLRALSVLLLSLPPVVLSLALVMIASRTGWLPVGGLPRTAGGMISLQHLVLPVIALALPVAAVLERFQSRAIRESLATPAILAARARGVPAARLVWRHALRLSLTPVLGIYGIIIGSLLSGSFVVEYVMTLPGLGRLMYDALLARDANLAAGCVGVGALFLAVGVLVADVALAIVDPRVGAAT